MEGTLLQGRSESLPLDSGTPLMRMTERADTILIVDDNLDLCASLAMMVMLEGFPPVTSTNGIAALEYLRNHPPPRFIILDMLMPMMDGREFLNHKRAEETLAKVPVFVYTGGDETLDLDDHPDVVCVIRKPMDPEKLVETF